MILLQVVDLFNSLDVPCFALELDKMGELVRLSAKLYFLCLQIVT